MNENDDLTALVTVLGGNPVGPVVIGAEGEALRGRGEAFVAQQGCNAYYELLDVEVCPEQDEAVAQ